MSSNLHISNNSYHPIEFAKSPELCIPAVLCTLIALAIIAVLATTPIPVGSVGFDCILTAGALSVIPGLGIAVYVLWRNNRTFSFEIPNFVEDYKTNYLPEESNLKQDWNREKIFHNGKQLRTDEVEAKFGENKWFVNQAFFNALFIKLKEIYDTDVKKVMGGGGANSVVIEYNASENALYGSNTFDVLTIATEERSKIRGKIRVDLTTGHAVGSWKVPNR